MKNFIKKIFNYRNDKFSTFHLYYLKFELLRSRINLKLPRFFQITKIGIVTTLGCFILSTSMVLAQTPTASTATGPKDEYTPLSNVSLYQFHAFKATVFNYLCAFRFVWGCPVQEGVVPQGATEIVNGWTSSTFESTSDTVGGMSYIAQTLEDAKIVGTANAQTPGFSTLNPVLKLWTVTRNVAIVSLVITSIILAFMILLRVREGQGYVTIVTAFPRIVIAIAFIVMSYALGGLMVDMANLSSNIVLTTFVGDGPIASGLFRDDASSNISNFPYSIGVKSPGECNNDKTRCPDYNVFRLMSPLVNFQNWGTRDCIDEEDKTENGVGGDSDQCKLRVKDIINTPTGINLLDGGIGIASAGASQLVIEFILQILLLMVAIKVFIALVSAFVQVLLRTVFAPIQFMLIPIQGFSVITSWMKEMLANILVFPATLLLLIVSAVLSTVTTAPYFVDKSVIDDFNYAPLLLQHSVGSTETIRDAEGNPIDQSKLSFQFLGKVLGVIVLTIIPTIPSVLKEAFQLRGSSALASAGATFKSAASKVPIVGGAISGMV